MDKYLKQVEKEELRHVVALKSLRDDFACRNSKAKIGDVVCDSCCIILIDEITATERLSVVYRGNCLTKKFVPLKSGGRSVVFENQQFFKILKKAGE
jgi:hypothetical protein